MDRRISADRGKRRSWGILRMTGSILVYGATGYTGKLIALASKAKGSNFILAGRDEEGVKAVASPLGLPWRVFNLSDRRALDAGIRDVAAVLCAAGPFSATSRPMADACIRNGVHYLDITGEIDVFEALARRDAEAKQVGVMLLPGVGFDVVPSDCLAAHLKRRLPDATDLKIYIGGLSSVSRGTAKTMVEGIADAARLRRNGRVAVLDRPNTGSCDFGEGTKPTIQVSWGDISTAYYSTGIPNIEVHFEAVPMLSTLGRMPGPVKSLLAVGFAQRLLKSLIDRQPEGPSDNVRRKVKGVLIGVARNGKGDIVRTRVRTPDGYALTAMTSVDAAARVASGEHKAGFQTPSLAFGTDYVLGFNGVTREDMND
jgi:short subunit dehydrogenase-like uncharacterized protein